ncbi:protein CHUP1, chloroplastic-like [Andrographis paniculata]|uniref:protein CHUP1, chloroplastic-like n=1 Tax=Andrographis paniculata TaxID=175694 RepID=UPI0021E828FF|nr:protein CHUP1, chloroplastic-like [Andrographis paniculata]
MAVMEKRDVCLRFNVGVAMAISVGGIVYAYFTIKKIRKRANDHNKNPNPPPGNSKENDSRNDQTVHDDDDDDEDLVFLDSTLRRVYSHNSIGRRSYSGDGDGLMSPDFDNLIDECNIVVAECRKNSNGISEDDDDKDRICMQERLEIRLHDMEAKIDNLKIESLASCNRRLETQLAAYARLVAELEAEKAKTRMLRKKIKMDAERNKHHDGKALDHDERKELEDRLAEMVEANQALKQENSELLQKLDYVQMLATSALESEEVNELKEESRCIKQRNEDLTKEIERIQADRWSDIEELVYLRWMNTCLRYELRSCKADVVEKPTPDHVGSALSPKSEDRVKQLLIENAFKEKGPTDITDVYSERGSSSLHSCVTDSGDQNEALPADSADKTMKTKAKVFSKLKKLLTRKGNSRKKSKPLERAVSVDNIAATYSGSSVDDAVKSWRNSSAASSSRLSFDLPRTSSRSGNNSLRNSDVGSTSTITRINSLTDEEETDWPSPGMYQQQRHDVKDELLKYAEALKNARPGRPPPPTAAAAAAR